MVKYSDGLDAVASALANPGRRQIISRLGAGAATSSELAVDLGIGLPALHKQLSVLAAADLIRSHKTGRVVSHRLRPEALLPFNSWVATRGSFWTHQLGALDDALTRTTRAPLPNEEKQ